MRSLFKEFWPTSTGAGFAAGEIAAFGGFWQCYLALKIAGLHVLFGVSALRQSGRIEEGRISGSS
jgi:succinate-acetate transporter protein